MKLVNEMKNDFPFTDGVENNLNIMRLKGYYSAAVDPYIANALRDWFRKGFGEMENRSST
ncbi:hypothetical protein LCGC14_2090610 [marine sediment metagenome]|uniref:Uncharacterized protein n=1 Tax=marine sediment metagenome TaxID=412755 RepID=A0A0F9H9N8_9ZZZZ